MDMAVRTPQPLRVVLTDDHAVVRNGYRRLLELEPDVRVVAEFGDGDGAYRWLGEHDADVLVLDLSMPGRSGFDVLQRLHQRGGPNVLVFTMHESTTLAARALSLGAMGYLTKSSPPEALVEAVRQVARGCRIVSVGADADPPQADAPSPFPHRDLSPREFEIFLLLAQGVTVERIAETRNLSIKTVSNYQTSIRQKTGLNNAVEMYRYALINQLVALPTVQN